MGFSAETIRVMAREIYGIEVSEARAAEIAEQATGLYEGRTTGRVRDRLQRGASECASSPHASYRGGRNIISRDISDLTLCEIADAIRSRKLSAAEVMEATLARIEQLQPVVNAFIDIDGDAALDAARRADATLTEGGDVPALFGVPLAHKDLLYRKGRVSTCGSKIRRNVAAEVTATALERLDAAGAIEVGTLNMAEFAAGGTGHNEHFGDCRNPWNTDHTTGGSSSGPGAAVAARLVPGSLGSDTGGSVRIPAGLCGIVGIKPTDGRVSRYGVMPRSWTSDTLGPMARTARDVARMMAVVSGYDPARSAGEPGTRARL